MSSPAFKMCRHSNVGGPSTAPANEGAPTRVATFWLSNDAIQPNCSLCPKSKTMKTKLITLSVVAALGTAFLVPTKMLPESALAALRATQPDGGVLLREFFSPNLQHQSQDICVAYGAKDAHASELEHHFASRKRSLLGLVGYMEWSILLRSSKGEVLQAFVVSSDAVDLRTKARPPKGYESSTDVVPLDCAPTASAKLTRVPSTTPHHLQFVLQQ